MTRKLRLDELSKAQPPWLAIGVGGFLALSGSYALARHFQLFMAPLWATGLAALLLFSLYAAFVLRLVGVPWRVIARLAPMHGLTLAVAFALLSFIDF
jgi:hypothetical protein